MQNLHNAPGFSRRQLLQALGSGLVLGGLGAAGMPNVWAQAAPQGSKSQGRLVVVFLRGAYDGLSAFVPYADREYYNIRPTIAIPAPDGSAQTALKLDNTFALHPALSSMLPLWQQGVLAFVPAAGLPAPNRSHFDAQYHMEIAQPGKTSGASGWLNRVAALHPQTTTALGIGEANPTILSGQTRVKLIPKGQAAERTGVLANTKTRQVLMDLYGGKDAVSEAFRQGADSRLKSAEELSTEKAAAAERREMAMQPPPKTMDRKLDKDGTPASAEARLAQMTAASNGAPDPVGLMLDAQHLGTLMRNDRNLSIGFLSAGGWDSHSNQGHVTGSLAKNLGNLGKGLTQLRQDFSEPGDVIVVMSEFGRTSAENGSKGTDHGYGNAMWLIGNKVSGGKWHGKWTGLTRENLNQARDLPVHHDYRGVLAQVLRSTFSLSDSALATALPDAKWDSRLDGMLRRA
ncbi:MAG: DUF1501 domain-containing protein [Pseudomonadota bacterium]